MSTSYKVLCGVPEIHCIGGGYFTDQKHLPKRAHNSHREAYRCYIRYLTRVLGWKPASAVFGPFTKGYINPENGRVRILTKQSRFGARLRRGKAGEGTKGSRYMPLRDDCQGVVIG